MAHGCYLMFFILSYLLLLSLAEEQRRVNLSCPSFSCGKFRNIDFPYSKRKHPECGFCLIDDCEKPVQKIQLGKDEPWFSVTSISQDQTVTLYDQVFQRHLDNRSCESFKNISLPSSPSISFEIQSYLTLFKCPKILGNIPMNFKMSCDDSMIYYNHPDDDDLPSLPPRCSLIQLPVAVSKTRYASDLFRLLTGNFSLKVRPNWRARRHCIDCPSRGGGQCLINSMGYLHCSNTESYGHKKSELKLGLGLGGGSIVLIALLSFWIVFYRKRQKYASANIHSGNNSSGPSSKSDLETGTVYFGVPIFSYSDLAEATNDFSREKELGDGGFGTVYYGKLKDGREVAVKRLYDNNYRRVEQFMNEVEILTRLRHKNLVSLFGCTSRYSQGLLLVYEFVANGTVADQLHGDRAKHGLLTWPIRMNIAIETASALAYLHASDIIHRDVKTNNILLDSNFCVKVADFGLSRLFPLDVTHVSTAPQGTPGYVDPEYHQCYQLTDKSDVYSFGVVLIELISSMPAVDMNRHRHEINLANLAINKIQKCAFDELIDPCLGFESDEEVKRMTTSVAELAFLCLQQDKELRPSMEEVFAELQRIKSGESKFENHEEKQDDSEGIKNTQPPPSPPYCDEDSLLKNMRLPPSPTSVTEKWVSISSTTPNASG
ncbi:LEAF RUST 10 DISEASE-RESISTANCE LOCUS RECEPTOR-LIKE PROTEIN KINASE-like 1.1 isoform X3 [Citrus clementina]|uniref:LEAF RUST 10 DISEASE-RESISTANCE LOCUS RECEPTOR-LIKE PROTEIN KINASE-like 1.1 isoform X3 n=1 Tax=Citrus clementina TaxID=85681 RepID=UPI000CED66AC|nr:LEAF RUST 10 DISEASE-RESISTANCE LOCUS RECEPTOR-LIKE PROTEIN KINASE-like 1.1 isoform X3 [Citrus x clementina]